MGIMRRNIKISFIKFGFRLFNVLKVESCKLYNNKYMITLTQLANTDIFASISVRVLKLLSRKVLFINKKDNRNC